MKYIEETNLKLESEEQLKNCEDMHIWVQPIKEYIKKLEAKEKRAKKVEELLEVYKGIDGGGSPEGLNKLYRLRDELEKELEELK